MFLHRLIERFCLHMYEPGIIYEVPLKDIQIPDTFAHTWIREKKWKRKESFYLTAGYFESQIVLTNDFVLVDGYSSYKLAKKYHKKHVPVVFTGKKYQKGAEFCKDK